MLTDAEIGSRIHDARLAAGYESGEAFAAALGAGFTQPIISRIENGKRSVSASELARIAELLGRPPQLFIESDVSGVPLFRRDPTVEVSAPAERALRWLEDFALRVRALRDFTQSADLPRPERLTYEAPQTFEESQVLADTLRRQLGIGSGPAPDMIEVVERTGCLIVVRDEFDGPDAIYVPRPLDIALLNGKKPAVRQRFTLAHELAHHLFHAANVLVDEDIFAPGAARRELLANVFAAHFLMPRAGIESELIRRFGVAAPKRAEHSFWLAYHFGVSHQAICYQLQNLKMCTRPEAAAWRAEDQSVLAATLGLASSQQQRTIANRWPPEFLARLRYALSAGVLDAEALTRHLDSDDEAVRTVVGAGA